MPVRAFIFDLDGVLTDTAEYHYLGWKRLADEEGLQFDRQRNEQLRGVARRESLEILLDGRQISEEQAQAWMRRKNSYYLELVRGMKPEDVLPGVRPLLAELRRVGLKVAIASASKNASQVVDLLGLRAEIDVLCDGHSVEQAKPAPDLFLFAAGELGVDPHQCVVVEDAAAGVAAAQAAGMRTIGLGPRQRVGAAEVVLPSLEQASLAHILAELC